MTTSSKKTTTEQFKSIPPEHIMVVKRSDLFANDSWQGVRTEGIESYLETIYTKHTFLPRPAMENDPTYKQIIPYVIFVHDNKLFLMQRALTASETRLRNKRSLGIGGHVRQEDIEDKNLLEWATREFNEEVSYTGSLEMEFIGLLNDDSNDVGKVHCGLVMLAHGDSSDIKVQSELKSGTLVPISECFIHYDELESWSQMVLTALKNRIV